MRIIGSFMMAMAVLLAAAGTSLAEGKMETIGSDSLREARNPSLSRSGEERDIIGAIREEAGDIGSAMNANRALMGMSQEAPESFRDEAPRKSWAMSNGVPGERRQKAGRRAAGGETASLAEPPSMSEVRVFPSRRRGR